MATARDLQNLLYRIDGRGYPAYKEIAGKWTFPGFTLQVDHVQGDPFAAPSRLRVVLSREQAPFPLDLRSPRSRALGVEWLLARRFAVEAGRLGARRGSGKSGILEMDAPGQEVLERTALRLFPEGGLEARFFAGLPAAGRRILGRQAAEMLLVDLPRLVEETLLPGAYDGEELRLHAETNEDASFLRDALAERGLVAFVADGAILPRRSGVDDRPLEKGAVPFQSPPSLRVEVDLPNRGKITGMGIPRGVTLIVGGGFHGKSTLLRGLERGVWNHPPGDGREFVLTLEGAVKIRAEDGRSVSGVDISPFIRDLPGGRKTSFFSTSNASGSTSQAANIMEALEAGAEVLLLDEDTAATNFMIRDHRMQELISREREPIVPFVDRARSLHEDLGISTILVMGGSGDYFDVADLVIAMEEYLPREVTEKAREIARRIPTGRVAEAPGPMERPGGRIPLPASIDPSKGRREVSLKSRGLHVIQLGRETIDLKLVEQIVDSSQTRALGLALLYLRERALDGRRTLAEALDLVEKALEEEGLDVLDRRRLPDLAAFRRFELAAALNRLRTLRVKPSTSPAG